MHIWVDADACPNVIKDVLFRAANRTKINMTLVANKAIYVPPSPFIKIMVVRAGFDVADNQIVAVMQKGDLVITADIPLADAVIDKEGIAINPRGELYTKENIKQRLSMRNFSESLRSTGVMTGGPAPLTKKDTQAFANSLDRFLTSRR
ncbi:MAG: YaiI/YqxD family protein [Gammaproteobacteria bacterium]|nr:YaiI/YqxD family protein [Gammaproteobacteria bacterium]